MLIMFLVHFYNYILDPFTPDIYPTPRFASEYGYQSMPSIETWLTATDNISDLQINSDFLRHRQHHPLGSIEMKLLTSWNLRLPDESHPNYYKAFIYYSQIVQAESVRIQTEKYRRYKSTLDQRGQGYTMGALFWQLNDVWVAPTWSSIDYTGKYKMLQYFAMKFFAPIIITGYIDITRELQIYVVSDITSNLEDITVHVKVYNWSSFQVVNDEQFNTTLNNSEATIVKSLPTDDYLSSLQCGSLSSAKYNCFFYLTLEYDNFEIGNNYVLPGSLAYSNVPNSNVSILDVKQLTNSRQYEIILKSDNIALFVWLDTKGINGEFSENGFMQVEARKIVGFESYSDITTESLKEVLSVTSLKDPVYT